jgi:hypothetical protein
MPHQSGLVQGEPIFGTHSAALPTHGAELPLLGYQVPSVDATNATSHKRLAQLLTASKSRLQIVQYDMGHDCRQLSSSADPFGNFEARSPRRVVVTGLGLVTPLGIGAERVWESLVNGGCGVRELTAEDLPKVCFA